MTRRTISALLYALAAGCGAFTAGGEAPVEPARSEHVASEARAPAAAEQAAPAEVAGSGDAAEPAALPVTPPLPAPLVEHVRSRLGEAARAGLLRADERALELGLRHSPPTTCTYRTYAWSTVERRSVGHRDVAKAYADVVDDERSPEDPRCTVCREDQVSVDPAAHGYEGVEPVRVCWVYADDVGRALEVMAEGGFDLQTLTAYRPGRTRGAIVDGLRTEWSNHSFGTAVDLNAHHNGLYRSCNVREVNEEAIGGCRLGVGGAWSPSARPGSTVVRGGPAYRAFTEEVGWAWGGEIRGATRDLMHFSLTGY